MNGCSQVNNRSYWSRVSLICVYVLVYCMTPVLWGQTGGQGAIEGTITDTSGAAVAGATVTAKNLNTGVTTARVTTSSGFYNINPLIPGQYTLTVVAHGFHTVLQENVTIDALHVSGINLVMKVGSATETVTVSDAPPALETTNATLGGTMENNVYTELPLLVSGNQQRDVTQFSNLLPGAQVNPAGRSSVISGTASRLGEVYLDGLPLTTISQQGDNRPIFNIVPLEAIEQIQVVTSSPPAGLQGAGLENYTLKSGGNQYHGSVFDFVRNTAFDTWSFSSKLPNPATGLTTKPVDHQNEFGFTVGGPISIPHLLSGHDKLFFFATYDRLHSRSAPNYTSTSIPTAAMRAGDFRELLTPANGGTGLPTAPNTAIYDPTSLASCTAHSTNGPCRYQYGYGPGVGSGPAGNPVLIGTPNVIPASQLSPIAQYMQKFLPATNAGAAGAISGNYLGGIPSGYDNWLYSGRIDYNISDRQRLSLAVTGGNRHAVPYTSGSAVLPVPYLASTFSTVAGHWAELEHSYTITSNMVNQFKFGFMNFGGPPIRNTTQGIAEYAATAAGINGLPPGQASEEMPTSIFGSSTSPQLTQWGNGTSGNTSTSVSETYSMIDNLEWIKGKHAMTFGFQYQRLENNASSADGPSTAITLNWSTNDTASINGSNYGSNGYTYASYMIGAVNSTGATLQPFSVLGARYRPFAPYFQDDYKVTSKLTLNLGLRWDYIPTYTEVLDRWSFLNPNLTNPVTGNPGVLQFAGNHGGAGVSCGCRTPVNNYYQNWGPRLGFAYSVTPTTVIRGGFGVMYSHGGGTGGAGGAGVGTGQTGFNSTASFTANSAGPSAGPAFYLNNNPGFASANANFGGPGYTLPAIAAPSASTQALGVGNTVNGSGGFVKATTSIAYADPYFSGRAPEFSFFNFGIQQALTKDITISANYAGSESHFIAGASGIRGFYAGQIDPRYFALGSLLSSAATPANLQKAQAIMPGIALPYAGYGAAAATSAGAGQATIGHMLTWMPQYTGTTDTWGVNSANANYHAFQLSVVHTAAHGLTLNINYTYSKQIDDAGTIRSGFAIPANLTLNGVAWKQDRIDRSLSTLNQPQSLAIYGIYKLPFGKGAIGGNNFLVRAIAGGWQFSSIYTYASGYPLAITSSACTSSSYPGQGTCMPDQNPSYTSNVRQNGSWGHGVTAKTLGTVSYINGYNSDLTPGNGAPNNGVKTACAASNGPFCNSGNFMIGDLTRTGAYGLRAPSQLRLTSGLRRTFDITERTKFIFAVDCQNVTNSVTFGINAGNVQIGTNVNSTSFGAVNYASADSRDFQFSGRLKF
jgi:Carboxypeptidase regulatory-like domain/TonB dependent receptor